MYASGLGWRADAIILAWLQDTVRAPRFRDASYTDDEGRFRVKGGYIGHEERAAVTGFTKADVAAARTEFRGIGLRLSIEQVDVLLSDAWTMTGCAKRATLSEMETTHEAVRAFWRSQRKVRTERLRAAGRCIVCGKNATSDGKSTCHDCGLKANARAKRRRGTA